MLGNARGSQGKNLILGNNMYANRAEAIQCSMYADGKGNNSANKLILYNDSEGLLLIALHFQGP